jgi:signal transduction histidine kinase
MEPAAIAYRVAFALTGVVCLAGLLRVRDIEQLGVRRGLAWLLGTTAVWALLKAAFLFGQSQFSEALYTVGLVSGFATVWAWLYFCSAYTGRDYHQNSLLRALGAGAFLFVVGVKLTNPVHGLYFTTSEATEPFAYLAIEHGVFHWTVTGLSYALATVGLFMLFELYLDSGYNTRPLAGLTVLLALPVILDIVAVTTPALIDIIYAPLGVAAFLLGTLFLFERRFLAVQTTGADEDPVVFLDGNDRIRDYTPAATEAFPELRGELGRPLTGVLSNVEGVLDGEETILERERNGERRYFLTTSTGLGDAGGRVVVFSDVTTAERRRRELSRHNRQLEELASALNHELRNVIQIINSRLALARTELDEDTLEGESVQRAAEGTDRMARLVDDFRSLARYGQTVEQLKPVAFRPAIADGWQQVDTGEMAIGVDGGGEIRADPGRLRQLLVNAFEFNRHNGASTVHVELLDDGFAIADDGEPPAEDTSGYFAFGEAVPDAESGMKLPNVRAFARVHGWSVAIDTEYREGTRLVVRNVTVERADEESADAESAGEESIDRESADEETTDERPDE